MPTNEGRGLRRYLRRGPSPGQAWDGNGQRTTHAQHDISTVSAGSCRATLSTGFNETGAL